MATARGAAAVRTDRRGFARLHWRNWSPAWPGKDAVFERAAPSWDNPDWVDVTLRSYRARWGEADPDPRSRWLEDRIKSTKTLSLPAIYIQGAAYGVNLPSAKFTGPFAFVTLAGVGHFPQREHPQATTRHLLNLFTGDPAMLADTHDRSLFIAKPSLSSPSPPLPVRLPLSLG